MFNLRWKKSHHDVSIPSGCCSTHLILCVGPSTYYRGVSNSATQEQKNLWINQISETRS